MRAHQRATRSRTRIALATSLLLLGCVHSNPAERTSPESDHAASSGVPPASLLTTAIERTRARLYAEAHAQSNAAHRRATEEFLSGLISSAWRMAHAARALHAPRFQIGHGIVGLPGLFNPDNLYRSALLDPEGAYRITGTRGSHARFTLQILDAYPLVGLSKGLVVIDLDERGVAVGEDFVLYVGGSKPPGDDASWWPMPDGARAILARQTFNDWAAETPTAVRIERLDAEPTIPTGPTQADLAAEYLDRMTTLWADRYLAGLRRLPENAFPPIRPSGDEAGGLPGQQGVITRYRLAAEEALVVTVRASDAAYQSIQLGNAWFVTQNPVRFPSSRNRTQARVDADGQLRFVISERDPGVANWLATAGAEQGFIMIRWQGIHTGLGAADQPQARRVPLAQLDAWLPADTKRVGPAERALEQAGRLQLPALKP